MTQENKNTGTEAAKKTVPAAQPPMETAIRMEAAVASPQEAGAELRRGVEARVQAEVTDALGAPADFESVRSNPDKLGDLISRLSEAWNKSWDKFFAIFAPLGLKPSEVSAYAQDAESALRTPGSGTEEGYEEWQESEISDRSRRKAEHAKRKLDRNPTWATLIHQSCEKYADEAGNHLTESTVIAFIEMESSFNPNARPRDKKTGELLSSAVGLAQAINASTAEYCREVKPNANMEDPATAIDFCTWHILRKIRNVNKAIEDAPPDMGFKTDYRLTAKSPVRDLYLAYNSGEMGYLLLRRYLDNKTALNFAALAKFQKRTAGKHADGTNRYEWEQRYAYAGRVAEVATAFRQIEAGPEVAFDSPPVPGGYSISSGFGERTHPTTGEKHSFHNGIDISAPPGTPALAVKTGTVEQVSSDSISGNYIKLRCPDGTSITYCHLQSASVQTGAKVAAGAEIGKIGSTGRSTGPHLHLSFCDSAGNFRDPRPAVARASSLPPSTSVA